MPTRRWSLSRFGAQINQRSTPCRSLFGGGTTMLASIGLRNTIGTISHESPALRSLNSRRAMAGLVRQNQAKRTAAAQLPQKSPAKFYLVGIAELRTKMTRRQQARCIGTDSKEECSASRGQAKPAKADHDIDASSIEERRIGISVLIH